MNLPPAITTYLTAHNARDVDRAIASYTPDATVIDEGRSHHGTDEIREWLAGAASEYTYTTELISVTRLGEERYDVVQHLEGDFPGGVVDLHYRFTLRGAAIVRLVIEP
ncbi:nuclear transport factor 2 family protein [Dactylosporangium sp. NPDC049742]|uniref:nuclear transport factor 2 family protein n=1 Tax=Dactylosporangium sp. NPDC049742 TaxID=3154737 RepID=UPI003415A30C